MVKLATACDLGVIPESEPILVIEQSVLMNEIDSITNFVFKLVCNKVWEFLIGKECT